MDTLEILQKLYRLGRILSKIAYICTIVAACLCAAGIVSLALGAGTLRLGGVSIRGLIRADANLSEGALYAAMTAGLIVMVGEAVLARFAAGYFARVLADGTPFRAESARSLLRLGILTICIPLGTQIIAEIVCAVLEKASSCTVELPLGADSSVALGVMFIVLSLVCRCAAEQLGERT